MAPTFPFSLNQALLLSVGRISRSFYRLRHAATGQTRLDFLREEIPGIECFNRIVSPSIGRAGNLEEKEDNARSVEISHPWPEWVKLMDHLLKKCYLDRGTFQSSLSPSSSSKDLNPIRTACLNFSRERSELIRYLSRKDIQILVGSGCPSLDRKVVNSGKRLRAYVGTNEGEICSLCKLRGNCERAYVKANEDERGRTVDVMRILLTHGLDAMSRSVVEGPSLSQVVKESTRKLLNDIVDLSIKGCGFIPEDLHRKEKDKIKIPMKQGDWICPRCSFLNFAKNIKCLRCAGLFQERLAKLREDREHLPLKKGDWICDKCNFFNFAKNVKCVQCNEKPTNRKLNPGEWECASQERGAGNWTECERTSLMAAMATPQGSMISLSLSPSSFFGESFLPYFSPPVKFDHISWPVVMKLKRWERKECKSNGLPVLHKMHVKVGDTVKIIAGDDKGKIGEIADIFRHNSQIIIKDINMKTKHMKSKKPGEPGQILKFEAPIHSSNVMLYSKEQNVTSRVGHKTLEDGSKVRFLIKTGEIIDSAEGWRKAKEERKEKRAESWLK